MLLNHYIQWQPLRLQPLLFFYNINAIRGVSHSSPPPPETILLWISSFYDLSLNYNLVLAVLPSFTPEMFYLNLLLLFLSAHCFVELRGFSSHAGEYACRMCTYSHDPSNWGMDSSGGPPDSSKLVCVKQTHSVSDLFHPVNKYLVMYLVHIKHHSKHGGGRLQTWIKSEPASQGSCNIL